MGRKMSAEEIISQIEKGRKKQFEPMREDYFTRIAYILENERCEGFSEKLKLMIESDIESLISKKELFQGVTPMKREKRLRVRPFYLPSIKKLRVINEVASFLRPVAWAVQYCDTAEDLIYCSLLLKIDDPRKYEGMLKKYTIKTLGVYLVLKRIEEKISPFLREVESSFKN